MKTKITVLLAFAMFVVSISAGTTKKGYVYSTSPQHVEEFISYIGKHDMAAAARMIKEKKVSPLKEGVDVVLVPTEVYESSIGRSTQAVRLPHSRMVRFKLRGAPFGVFVQNGVYWTAKEAITP